MSPSDLYILAFVIAVPILFLVFLGMLLSMARRSRSWMGHHWAAQEGWHAGFPSGLPPGQARVPQSHSGHRTVQTDGLIESR
jgi:apolipoprotein N-acyltransferase